MYQGALRLKYKKLHKAKVYKNKLGTKKTPHFIMEPRFFIPKFSDFAIQTLSGAKITNRHIETGRRHLRRTFKKRISIKINMFPYHSYTQKPISARMGKGKGRVYG